VFSVHANPNPNPNPNPNALAWKYLTLCRVRGQEFRVRRTWVGCLNAASNSGGNFVALPTVTTQPGELSLRVRSLRVGLGPR
jgi:hypothetical protein